LWKTHIIPPDHRAKVLQIQILTFYFVEKTVYIYAQLFTILYFILYSIETFEITIFTLIDKNKFNNRGPTQYTKEKAREKKIAKRKKTHNYGFKTF
jgi:hypothetical protein